MIQKQRDLCPVKRLYLFDQMIRRCLSFIQTLCLPSPAMNKSTIVLMTFLLSVGILHVNKCLLPLLGIFDSFLTPLLEDAGATLRKGGHKSPCCETVILNPKTWEFFGSKKKSPKHLEFHFQAFKFILFLGSFPSEFPSCGRLCTSQLFGGFAGWKRTWHDRAGFMACYLVGGFFATHLKNMNQNGNLPPIFGVKIP